MDLIEYAVSQGGTGAPSCPVLAKTAQDAGCSAGTLYMIARGHKPAGPKLAGAIERATEGKVTRNTLRPDYFGASAVDLDSAA
jgi:DNA-binding transcriptional regulator YdaS (Cro superfamily)